MADNYYMYFVVALVPLFIGAIYYHPKVAGKAWMKTNGFTEESMQGANMGLIFLLTYIFSLLLSSFLPSLSIHAMGLFQLMVPEITETGSAAQATFIEVMGAYGDRYRSFGHGAAHGAFVSIFLVLPILAIVAMFERRGWKYVLIHFVYWLICLVLMCGLLCQFLVFSL